MPLACPVILHTPMTVKQPSEPRHDVNSVGTSKKAGMAKISAYSQSPRGSVSKTSFAQRFVPALIILVARFISVNVCLLERKRVVEPSERAICDADHTRQKGSP